MIDIDKIEKEWHSLSEKRKNTVFKKLIAEVRRLQAARLDYYKVIDGLLDQQAMPDEWWVSALAEIDKDFCKWCATNVGPFDSPYRPLDADWHYVNCPHNKKE